MKSGFTQEMVAEKINVSRQTISNWENEKSYPDIISVIELSSLYSISLDDLLKGDEKMMEHLEESTNVVKSTRKLIQNELGCCEKTLRNYLNGTTTSGPYLMKLLAILNISVSEWNSCENIKQEEVL